MSTRAERRRVARLERPRGASRSRPVARKPIWRSPIAAVSGLALGAAVILIVAFGQPATAPAGEDLIGSTSVYPANLAKGSALGRPDAPVTLDVWSDFQCPFCGQFARTYLPRLVTDFVVRGQLRIVAHDVDFVGRGVQNESVDAAVAASCAADQNRYWELHDVLFANQNGENEGAFSRARLAQMAAKTDIDVAAWNNCLADPGRATTVATTTADALTAGINSTPTLVLNGTRSAGLPRSYVDLANAIDALQPASTAP
jgi:protein-disulfide isomerase